MNHNSSPKITHKRKKKELSEKDKMLTKASIFLTLILLLISGLIGFNLFQQEKDSVLWSLIMTFCIFNLGEAVLTIYVVLFALATEYENRSDLIKLIYELKKSGYLRQDFEAYSNYEEI